MIRIHLDGEWSAMEFAEFFSALSAMYFLPLPPGQVEMKWSDNGDPLTWTSDGQPLIWTDKVKPGDDLRIVRVQYGSPGFTDLVGLGAVLKEIRLFIQFLCERRARLNLLDIEREERKLRVDAMRKRIESDPNGLISERLHPFLTQEDSPLLDLIAQRKITGAVDAEGETP